MGWTDEAVGVKGEVVLGKILKDFVFKKGFLLTRQLLDSRLVMCA